MKKPVEESTGQRKAEDPAPADKRAWEEPKLTFVEPKLTRHGKLEKITRGTKDGFFGQFSP